MVYYDFCKEFFIPISRVNPEIFEFEGTSDKILLLIIMITSEEESCIMLIFVLLLTVWPL